MATLDTRAVRALRTNLSARAFLDVIEEYILDTARLTSRIVESCAAEDWADLRMAAHQLKSTSMLVGATELAEACALLERAGTEGGPTRETVATTVALAGRSASATTALLRETARTDP